MPKIKKPASTTESAAAIPPQLKPAFTKSPDYKSFYTNFAQSGYTAFDIWVNFGETSGSNPDGTLPIEMKAKVSMTPVEAKLVALIIASSVQKFEKQFGKVAIPKGLGLAGVDLPDEPPTEGV